jgi:LacI family transcriptional regulator
MADSKMTRHSRHERSQATLQDVARRAGVAPATASYVLNNKPKAIGAATRERVLTAASEIGYRPNMAARSLVTRQTNIVALWVPSVATAFASRVIAEIQKQARPHGYEVLICDAHMAERAGPDALLVEESLVGKTPNASPSATLMMPVWNVDGIIAFFGSSSRRVRLGWPRGHGIPTVSMGAFPIEGTDFVGLNLFGAAQDAVRWLVASGRRVAFLVPAEADFAGDERREAYASVMREAGQEPFFIRASHNSRAAAHEAVCKYLQASPAPGALFCYNDYAAIGAARALREARLSVPGDILLVGCDGIEDIDYLDWPLSTIALPVGEMCQAAWQFLEARLRDPASPPQHAMLAGQFQIRI